MPASASHEPSPDHANASALVDRSMPSLLAPLPPRARSRRAVALGIAGFVLVASAAAAIAATRAGAVDPLQIRSVAVLPFVDHSPDTTRRYFADGLHDAVITELSRHPQLSVRAHTSVEQYRNTRKTLPEIARELNVDGIIEGSIQREGNSVRITAQLLHGPTDRHMWAEGFRGALDDALTLQDSVADAIARHVQVAAFHREARNTQRSTAKDMLLRELILRGRHAEIARSQPEVLKAREAYEHAFRLDSTYAPAVAALSNIHTVIARYGFGDVHASLDTARVLALRAVQLDSTLSEARTALGISYADGFQFDAADRELSAAIRLSPSDAQAHSWYAMYLAAMGRGPESLREIRRALELDPFALRGYYITLNAAEYLTFGRRTSFDKAAGTRWSGFLAREPGEPWAYRADAYDLAEAGKCDAARAQIARTAELAPRNIQTPIALANIEWWCGDKAKAHAMLEKAKLHPKHLAFGKLFGFAHAWWGEPDSAFVWLDKAEWRLGSLMDLRTIRFLDPYRGDPRYARLLHKLGLPNVTP